MFLIIAKQYNFLNLHIQNFNIIQMKATFTFTILFIAILWSKPNGSDDGM